MAQVRAGAPVRTPCKCTNATKPNNAWWRRLGSGPRNPPVMTKTAHTRCDRLSKISHFSNLATAARPDLWCAPTGASAESRAAARAVPWIARHLTGRKSRTLIGESAV